MLNCGEREKLNIVLIGALGSGKSSLANLLVHGPEIRNPESGEQAFKISYPSVPSKFDAMTPPVDSFDNWFCVVDTIGFYLAEDQPALAIHKLIKRLSNNSVDFIFFVTDNRISRESVEAFHHIQSLIGKEQCNQHLVLIYTKCPTMLNKTAEEQSGFIESCRKASRPMADMLSACSNRWVIVDIPNREDGNPTREQMMRARREKSRQVLIDKLDMYFVKTRPPLSFSKRLAQFHSYLREVCLKKAKLTSNEAERRFLTKIAEVSIDSGDDLYSKLAGLLISSVALPLVRNLTASAMYASQLRDNFSVYQSLVNALDKTAEQLTEESGLSAYALGKIVTELRFIASEYFRDQENKQL